MTSHRSSWFVTTLLGVVTLLWLASVTLLLIPRFEQWFRELGVALPGLTLIVIDSSLHVVVAAIMMVVALAWRQVVGWAMWATVIWLVVLLLHVAFCLLGLVMPFTGPGR